MRIYLDLLIGFNFLFDFIILFGINYLLKRNTKIIRLILGALVGELSILFLFLPLSCISILLLKILLSILIIIVTFNYTSYEYFKNNIIMFYILSIILGGIVYILKISFKITDSDMISNLIILIIISPLILSKYLKYIKLTKNNISLRHIVDIYIKNKKYTYTAYIDTGNKLVDPYKKRPILLVNDDNISFNYESSILVPYKTLNNEGIIKCIKPDKIIIDNDITIKNILVGEAKKSFNIEDIKVILPSVIKEDIK